MYLCKDVLYLKQLGEQIKSKCIIRYFEETEDVDADIYEKITYYCGVLLERVLSVSEGDLKRNFAELQRTMIKNSKASKGKFNEADKYFLNTSIYRAYQYKSKDDDFWDKQAKFMEWKAGENPYRELQQASRSGKKNSAVNISAVWCLFEKILVLLDVCESAKELKSRCSFGETGILLNGK